jgi:hypothetical protein
MPNDRLDGGAAVHLASDRRGNPAHLAADPDAEPLCVVVAAIALSTWMRWVSIPVQRFQLGDHWPQSVAVEGTTVQCLACSTN